MRVDSLFAQEKQADGVSMRGERARWGECSFGWWAQVTLVDLWWSWASTGATLPHIRTSLCTIAHILVVLVHVL